MEERDVVRKKVYREKEMIINLIINTIYFYQSKKSTLISNRRTMSERQWWWCDCDSSPPFDYLRCTVLFCIGFYFWNGFDIFTLFSLLTPYGVLCWLLMVLLWKITSFYLSINIFFSSYAFSHCYATTVVWKRMFDVDENNVQFNFFHTNTFQYEETFAL